LVAAFSRGVLAGVAEPKLIERTNVEHKNKQIELKATAFRFMFLTLVIPKSE
jgi:hypothetical protein